MKGMTQKPARRESYKPRRIPLPEDMQVEHVEVWRKGNFMIWFHAEDQGGVIVDLLPRTLVRHVGELDELFSIVDALQNLQVKGTKVYRESHLGLSDAEFLDAGMAALKEMDDVEPDTPDISEETQNILNMLNGGLLDNLLKPPTKD